MSSVLTRQLSCLAICIIIAALSSRELVSGESEFCDKRIRSAMFLWSTSPVNDIPEDDCRTVLYKRSCERQEARFASGYDMDKLSYAQENEIKNERMTQFRIYFSMQPEDVNRSARQSGLRCKPTLMQARDWESF